MVLGIPAVTVATPTIRRYFDETQVRFTASEDPADLAEQIVALHARPAERAAMVAAARRFFDRYDFASERARYLEVVTDLIAHRRPAPRKEAA